MTLRKLSILLVIVLFAAVALAEDRAVCAVCGPREASGFEPVKATASYKGKQYFFCSTQCKVDFLKNPAEFLITDEGRPAPAFRLTTLDGNPISLADLGGKVVLLDFWATFCPPCVAALPELQALHSKYQGAGFSVVGVSVDDRVALVRKATGSAGVTYPLAQATAEVWNAYKVNALPALILVDRQGRIVKRFGGEADKQGMIAAIEDTLRR